MKGLTNAYTVESILISMLCFCVAYIYDGGMLGIQISFGLFVLLALVSVSSLLLSKGSKGRIKAVFKSKILDIAAVFTLAFIFAKGVIPESAYAFIAFCVFAIGWLMVLGLFLMPKN